MLLQIIGFMAFTMTLIVVLYLWVTYAAPAPRPAYETAPSVLPNMTSNSFSPSPSSYKI